MQKVKYIKNIPRKWSGGRGYDCDAFGMKHQEVCFTHPDFCCADLWTYLDQLLAIAVWGDHRSFIIDVKDKINTGIWDLYLLPRQMQKAAEYRWYSFKIWCSIITNPRIKDQSLLVSSSKSAFDVRGKIMVTCIDHWYWHLSSRSKGIMPEELKTLNLKLCNATVCCNTVPHDALGS